MAQQVPSGWYTDPTDKGQLRCWDGTEWTDHVSPTVAIPEPQPKAVVSGSRRTRTQQT